MNAAAKTRQAIAAGRRKGAVLGVLVFLVAGMGPGFSLGCYAALILLSHLSGHADAPGFLTGSLVAAGGMVGVVCAGSASILGGWIAGDLCASAAEFIRRALHFRAEQRERDGKGMTVLSHGRMSGDTEAEIRSRLSYLQAFRHSLHSIVVVGSAAHGARDSGSDIDIVVICKKKGFDSVQNAVCEQEMDEASSGRQDPVIEYTLLDPSQTQKLFKTASPFAYALRRGEVLEDDGYLENLTGGRHPRAPGRRYVLTALYENIIVPYYGSFHALEKNAKKNHCSRECCIERAGCEGLAKGGIPARVIMRMLYVTLPLNGRMPLTKGDVIAFAAQVYGEESAETVRKAARMARNDKAPVYFTDYQQFKRLAGALYREILGFACIDKAVRRMLCDGASMVQGKSRQLKDANLRKCVQ